MPFLPSGPRRRRTNSFLTLRMRPYASHATRRRRRSKRQRTGTLPSVGGECNACHNPHGSNAAGILKDRADKICYSCHADVEAAFVRTYTHRPVAEGTCTACHRSHGGVEKKLLRAAGSDLCAQCHKDFMKEAEGGSNHALLRCRRVSDVSRSPREQYRRHD